MAADLHNAIRLVRGIDHGETIIDGVRHWLLTIDIFAGGTRVHENPPMLVVGYGNNDCVNIFAIENFFVVARRRDAWILNRFLGGEVSRIVKIANGNALNSGHSR